MGCIHNLTRAPAHFLLAFFFHSVPRSCQLLGIQQTRVSVNLSRKEGHLSRWKEHCVHGGQTATWGQQAAPRSASVSSQAARLAPSSRCPQGFQEFCPFWPKTTLRLFTKHSHPHPSLPLDPQPASLEPGLHRAGHMNSGFLWCDGSLRSLCERRF